MMIEEWHATYYLTIILNETFLKSFFFQITFKTSLKETLE